MKKRARALLGRGYLRCCPERNSLTDLLHGLSRLASTIRGDVARSTEIKSPSTSGAHVDGLGR